MKRHEALAPLSREHHEALILAQLLKKNAPAYKGLPDNAAAKAEYALSFFTTKLQAHFSIEEQILQKVKKYDPAIAALTAEIMEEHVQLANLFNALQVTKEPEEALHKTGTALEDHIRKEERVLFPLIQQHCPEEVLATIIW